MDVKFQNLLKIKHNQPLTQLKNIFLRPTRVGIETDEHCSSVLQPIIDKKINVVVPTDQENWILQNETII